MTDRIAEITAIACINTKRKSIGFELNKHYCEMANERISELIDIISKKALEVEHEVD